MDHHRIAVDDGVELAIDVWPGDRQPVVLVHGLASNARLWDGVADDLAAAGHHVVAVDQRGHGRSSRPSAGYDFATVAADLAAVIDAAVGGPAVVAGQSWGGNVGVELAARHPASVAGLVCVDGGWIELRDRFDSWEACREALAPPRWEGVDHDGLKRRVRAWHPAWPETGIAGTMANFERLEDGSVRPWLPRDRHMAILEALWDHRPSERFPSLSVPVLFMPAGDGTAADAAAAATPRARVCAFAGADHDVHAERPAEVAAAIRDAIHDGFLA